MSAVASLPESTFRSFPIIKATDLRPDVFVRREAIPKGLLAAEATTYGWDTVNCVKASLVNELLVASDAYPKHLEMTLSPEENWAISASFGPWQIATGGSGAILMMKLPLTTASMTYGTDTLSITDGYALVSIKLRYVPQPPQTPSATGDNPIDIEKLIADANARTPDDPAVVVQRVNYGSATPSIRVRSLFESSMALMLNDNLSAFTHIFAVVNLNQRAASKEFTWLKPTYTSYAYLQGVDDESSYFAVLNQTEGRGPGGLTNQVAASAIPDGLNASILVSNNLFMRQMVLPGMTRAFDHATVDSFKLNDRGDVIEGTERIRLDAIRVGAVDYTPYMDTFVLQIVGDEMQINTKVSINISAGIDAYINATYKYVIGLTEKDDGSLTLDFEPVGEPVVTTWNNVALWVTLTVAIVGIIAAVVGAAITEKITNVTIKIIVIAVITVVAGILAATPSTIASVITDGAAAALPAIGPMIDEATEPVEWSKTSGFTLKTAELNGSFQLGGVLSTTPPTA